MKKGLAVLLTLMLLFSFAGCQSGGSGQETEEDGVETQAVQNDAAKGENILIAYFSLWENAEYPENVDTTSAASVVADGETRYGTTELMAGMLKEQGTDWRGAPFHPNRGVLSGRLRSGGGSESQGTGQGSAAGTRGQ